jgi:inward rectifier potassium channel
MSTLRQDPGVPPSRDDAAARRRAAVSFQTFSRNVIRKGSRHGLLRDLYAALLRASWLAVLAVFAFIYLVVNVAFAGLYLLAGDAIAGARHGSFEDAFSFSVQTLSTVGYGALSPRAPWGDVLVPVETFTGIFLVAVATGICFSKFARPRAGMMFADKVVIGPHNGRRCLMIRVANARGGEIVEATMRLTAIKSEVTAEGKQMRRLHDLALERSSTPFLMMSFLAIHPIDEKSALWGLAAEDLRRGDVRINAVVTGIEGVFMQTVYVTAFYDHTRIICDAQFVDMLTPLPDGRTLVDLRRLSDVMRA